MNRDYVLFHLREAADELARTIAEIEADLEYDYGEFVVAATHLYHHLNTAWNAQDSEPHRTDTCSEADFAQWRRFPTDLDLSV